MRGGRALTPLLIAGFLAILSSTASKSPTLPLFAQHLGAGPEEVGLIAATSTIVGIVVNALAGTLSDIYGRRKLLLASGTFFATAPFLYLLVSDTYQLIAVRAYHGIATATFVPASMATVADAFRERRGEALGYLSSATLFGRLVAPALAGVVLTLYSFPGTYLMCGVFGVAAMAALITIPEPERVTTGGGRREPGVFLEALLNPSVSMAGGLMALTYFAMQALETFLPLYLSSLGVDP